MKKKRKKKIKIKKKNFALFIIVVMLLAYSITQVIFLVVKVITSPKKEIEIKEEKPIEKKKKETKPDETKKEEKSNDSEITINEKIDYFNIEYLDRYLSYKRNNNTLTDEQIIKNVNMQLDKTPYKDIIKANNLNTEKVLVNKYYYLEEDYVPDDLETISSTYALSNMKLVHEAKEAFESLSKAAAKEKLKIIAMSSYRSYSYQVNLYNRYVKQDGKEDADTYSGRPGHSEHQTGLAVDVYNQDETYTNFEKTKEYKWMQQHAQEYGFILRFPKDKEDETGYHFESWHYRYVGKEIAEYIKENNISFEEYYATIIKDW